MRGKPRAPRRGSPADGLIPAHAGKTSFPRARRLAGWAHPRACGENDWLAFGARPESGSSPRMRGKRTPMPEASFPLGLIPAHAGKTRADQGANPAPLAHPRACGENDFTDPDSRSPRGSSPRMRGKLCELLRGGGEDRLIPAHAGKTGVTQATMTGGPAHPRACGENGSEFEGSRSEGGSSPRMRGKL